jgi:hypothetical protein
MEQILRRSLKLYFAFLIQPKNITKNLNKTFAPFLPFVTAPIPHWQMVMAHFDGASFAQSNSDCLTEFFMTTLDHATNCDICSLEHGAAFSALSPVTILPDDRRLNHAGGCGRYFLPLPAQFSRVQLLPQLIRTCLKVAISCLPHENVELFEPFRVECGRDKITMHRFADAEEQRLAQGFIGLSEDELQALLEHETDFSKKIVLSIVLANQQAQRLMHVTAGMDMDASYFDYWNIELQARPNKPSQKTAPTKEKILIAFNDSSGVQAAESVLKGKSQRYEHKEADPESTALWYSECEGQVSKAPRSTRRIYRDLRGLGFVPISFGEFLTKYAILYLGRLIGREDAEGNHLGTTRTPEGIKIELHWESFGSRQTEEVPAGMTPDLVLR